MFSLELKTSLEKNLSGTGGVTTPTKNPLQGNFYFSKHINLLINNYHHYSIKKDYYYSFRGSTVTTNPLSTTSAVHCIFSPCSKFNSLTSAEGITVVIDPLLNLIFVLYVTFMYHPIISLINIILRFPLINLIIFPTINPKGLYIRSILISYRKSLGISLRGQKSFFELCPHNPSKSPREGLKGL